MENKEQINRNIERGKYCKGCAWLHIGNGVDHNHCDLVGKDEMISSEFDRANGRFRYINNKLIGHFDTCIWFWDKEINPNPSKSGVYYKNPISDKCPKVPEINLKSKCKDYK